MKWTDEEKGKIIAARTLTDEELGKLQAALPGRTATQIYDQYRQILKPRLLAMFSAPSASSSTTATPSSTPKKRSRMVKEDSN